MSDERMVIAVPYELRSVVLAKQAELEKECGFKPRIRDIICRSITSYCGEPGNDAPTARPRARKAKRSKPAETAAAGADLA